MAETIDLAMLKRHLNVSGNAQDVKLVEIANRAERAVFNYMGFANLEAWYTEHGELTFFTVEAAVLLAAEVLYTEGPMASPLTDAVKSLVRPYRSLKAS